MWNLVSTRRLSPLSGAHVTQSCRHRNSWNTSAVLLITAVNWNNDGCFVSYYVYTHAQRLVQTAHKPNACVQQVEAPHSIYRFVAMDFPLKFFSLADDSDWAHRKLIPCYWAQPMGVPLCRTSGSINRAVEINHICRSTNINFSHLQHSLFVVVSFATEMCVQETVWRLHIVDMFVELCATKIWWWLEMWNAETNWIHKKVIGVRHSAADVYE